MSNIAVASMTFAKLKPQVSLEEARKIWDENVIAALKQQKGFIGGLLLVSENIDEGIAVALWDSKEDSEAVQKSGVYQEQVKKFAAFIAPPIERKLYNVNSEVLFLQELDII